MGRIDAARVAEHRQIVSSFDLQVDIPLGLDRESLITVMGRDKKALTGLTFVLDGPNGVETVTGVTRASLDAAFDAMEKADGR
jgi:5-deoxy-5-amino-3-dehydroquinate synthase